MEQDTNGSYWICLQFHAATGVGVLQSLGVIAFVHEDGAGHQPENRIAPNRRI